MVNFSLKFVITPNPHSFFGMKPGALPPMSIYKPSLSNAITFPLIVSPVAPIGSFSFNASKKALSSKSNSSTFLSMMKSSSSSCEFKGFANSL